MGRLNFIILNTDKVVGELLQKRKFENNHIWDHVTDILKWFRFSFDLGGAIYSSRIDSEYFFHCATRGASLGSCPYNDYYKKVKAIGKLMIEII